MVRTDHVLFIAAGAFHVAKPSDLIPELQGRFPIRVELRALDADDFERILVEPENSLIRQYTALLGTEKVELRFDRRRGAGGGRDGGRDQRVRREHRRTPALHGDGEAAGGHLVRRPERAGEVFTVTGDSVRATLADLVADRDLARYIL